MNLFDAVKTNNYFLLKNKLFRSKEFLNVNYANIKCNQTILHIACENNNLKIVQLLLNNDANVNSKYIYECTPLFYTVDSNIIRMLITYGANVDVQDINGDTYLHYMCACGFVKT